jgi:hypothetical protein
MNEVEFVQMKRFEWIIILAAILSGACRRQEERAVSMDARNFRLIKLHYTNSGGEKGLTHYYYDPDGLNYLAIWHLVDSSRSSVNTHTLDSAGRMIGKARQFSDGIRSEQQYLYDEGGKLVREDFNRSDSVTGTTDYYYDHNGRLDFADCRGLNGWFYGRIEYTWEENQKTGALIMRDSSRIGSILYEYDGDRLVREKWDFNGEWEQEFLYEYREAAYMTYTTPNVFIRGSPWFRVAGETYDFSGESGGPSYYTYDETGRLVRKEFLRSDGLRTVTTYEYDSTGVLKTSHREYDDGRTAEFIYWYGIDRKLLVKTFQWEGGNSGSETYRYRDGALARGEYNNMDGWLNGVLEFSPNEFGMPVRANFTSLDGNHAVIEFSYDRNFNLTRIHWIFNSGHTQTYRYEYETY